MAHYLPAELCKHNRNFTSTNWYSNTWMASQDVRKWWYRITIGSGGRGKTYSGRKLVIKNFVNKGKKFVWLRLTQSAVDNLLKNNAQGLFPAELINKYKITVSVKSNAVYINDKLAGYVASLQGYYNNKGQEFDLLMHDDYSVRKLKKDGVLKQLGDFDVIADELIREETERNSFDIKKAFQNQIENMVRERTGIRVFIYANYLTDIKDIEELFDIQLESGKFGIYRNPKTKTVIEYLKDSETWAARKKVTMAGVLNVDGGRFANKRIDENKLIIYNHKLIGYKILFNIKIKNAVYVVKQKGSHYVLCYFKSNQNRKTVYPLRPEFMSHKNQTYSLEIRKLMIDIHSNGRLSFTSFSIYQDFIKTL